MSINKTVSDPSPWQIKLQKKLDDAGPFFAQWVKELEITVENNQVVITDTDRDAIGNQQFTQTIFEEDKDGNVTINYWNLNGETVNYWLPNESRNSYTDKYKTWSQTRLKDPKPGGPKYLMPKGQGTLPFIPWPLVEKFRRGDTIKTLFLTEGAKKAFLGANKGIDVVGLPSITCYKESDGTLFRDVCRLIERCKVEHVVILWDADCRDISLKDLAAGEELTQRPFSFFNQVKNIRKLLKLVKWEKVRETPRIHFMHPNKGTNLKSNPKGLDDVLVEARGQQLEEAVINDLRNPEMSGHYFYRIEISQTTDRLYRYFNLDPKDAEGFYHFHGELIGGRTFMYNKNLYTYIDSINTLEMTLPGWASKLVAVGDDFFIDLEVPTLRGESTRRKLTPRRKETLSRRYGKDFNDYINYYEAFCNKADHFNHQPILEVDGDKFLNRYHPFRHVPEKGNCETTLDFIKHIFGTHNVKHPVTGQEIPNYEIGLDYLKLLLEQPAHILPVLILYSPENSTGKSTFFKLLAEIFKDNAIFVGNADLQSDFNSVYADKLLVMCEETLLERQKDTERIKAMSTASEITINEKNVTQYTVDFFAKFAFASNKSRMIYVSAQDERFWINKVPRATKVNPHLLEDLVAEIPYFVHYLVEREMATEDESRMWIHPGLLKTETLAKTVEINEPGDVSNIREKIVELFDAAPEGTTELHLPIKNIRLECKFTGGGHTNKYIRELLQDYLHVEQLRDAQGNLVEKRGSYVRSEYQYEGSEDYLEKTVTVEYRGRPYVFLRDQFFSEED